MGALANLGEDEDEPGAGKMGKAGVSKYKEAEDGAGMMVIIGDEGVMQA